MKMKIKKEDYQKLEEMIIASGLNTPENKKIWMEAGLSDTRWVWDLAHGAKATSYICSLYGYLDDSHITTALKKISV